MNNLIMMRMNGNYNCEDIEKMRIYYKKCINEGLFIVDDRVKEVILHTVRGELGVELLEEESKNEKEEV